MIQYYLEEYNMTMGQISKELKNEISHRAKAFKKLWQIYEDSLDI